MKLVLSVISSILIAVASSFYALASEYKVGDLVIAHPHILATVKSAPVAAGYLSIKNNGPMQTD